MPNPRLIKKRVGSIKNVGKITKALEMVSASKVQRLIVKALNAKPYAALIYEMIGSVSGDVQNMSIPLMRVPELVKNDLYILVSTNRGLAGSLNTNLFKTLSDFIVKKEGIKHSFVTIGKKGRGIAIANGELTADFSEEKDRQAIVSTVTRLIIDGFNLGIYDAIYVVFSEFINALTQKPIIKQILPISKSALVEEGRRESFGISGESGEKKVLPVPFKSYYYEPDAAVVLGNLLPYYIEIQIAESLYEAEASEHSARMIAMKNASDNAVELSASLLLEYNKARQSLITTEISDITTALSSLTHESK